MILYLNLLVLMQYRPDDKKMQKKERKKRKATIIFILCQQIFIIVSQRSIWFLGYQTSCHQFFTKFFCVLWRTTKGRNGELPDVWHLKSVSCRFISCRVTVAACVNKGYNKTVLLICFDFTILKPCKLTVTVTVTHNTGLLMTLEWSGRSIHPHTLLSLSFFKEVLKSFPDSYLLSLNLLFPALWTKMINFWL